MRRKEEDGGGRNEAALFSLPRTVEVRQPQSITEWKR